MQMVKLMLATCQLHDAVLTQENIFPQHDFNRIVAFKSADIWTEDRETETDLKPDRHDF